VNFPTSISTTSSLGRRCRIGARFCRAHRGRPWRLAQPSGDRAPSPAP
jgi:hypothetical protein